MLIKKNDNSENEKKDWTFLLIVVLLICILLQVKLETLKIISVFILSYSVLEFFELCILKSLRYSFYKTISSFGIVKFLILNIVFYMVVVRFLILK